MVYASKAARNTLILALMVGASFTYADAAQAKQHVTVVVSSPTVSGAAGIGSTISA